ncbi:transposase [Mesonia aestuariivivens]|uniref:Transposase n=1 Tax=Mesonia aestuariivivens TaxID=2796128 RepID=A0ABS6W657_9FLAO|nr:transposase [Mesonia aestuariivivens]MBW2962608.1 transposase [Mesonia aestuariivivens]
MKKRYYNPELTEQAVRLSDQSDNIKELADELGIEVQGIYKWRKAAKTAIFEYIEIGYNRKQLHSFLGYKTPYEVEQEFYQFKNGV